MTDSRETTEKDDPTPLLEWAAGVIGALLLSGALLVIVADAMRPQQPPDISVRIIGERAMAQGMAVTIAVSNAGGEAASDVMIEVAGREGDANVLRFDFLPPHSTREGVVVLPGNASAADLAAAKVRVASFSEP